MARVCDSNASIDENKDKTVPGLDVSRKTIALVLALLPAAAAFAADEGSAPSPKTSYVQAWIGGLSTDDGSWKSSDVQSGDNVTGDLGTLPFGGGAAQTLWGTGAWQIGFEGGGLGSWKSDNTEFRGTSSGGTNIQIKVDSTFFSLGVFMGAVVSVRPVQHVRLYVAGGPSVTWAWIEDNDNNDATNTNATIDFNGTESDTSFVAYGRAGVEFVLTDGLTFGASVRYADDEFQFGRAGDLTFDEPLWLLTLGARL